MGAEATKFAVPGINPDDANILVSPQQILLKSDYSHRHDADGGTIHLCDFRSALVFRSVSLPEAIDVNSVQTEFVEGMILVSATKRQPEQARPKRAPQARKATKKNSAKIREVDV